MIDTLAKFIFSMAALLLASGAGAAEPFPSGPAQSDLIRFQLAVYYTAAPSQDPMAAMRSAAARDWPALSIVTQMPKDPPAMLLLGRMEPNAQAKYPPPDARSLGLFGRGLSKTQADALQGPTQALQLNFAHPAGHAMVALRSAYKLAEQVARQSGGLLWDEETREMFTPDKWHEQRLANWSGAMPEVAKSINIHTYRSGALVRAVTLGMGKFGQPDIVVNQFPWTSNASMGSIIALLAQALAEGTPVGPGGNVDLNVDSTTHKKAGARALLAPTAATQTAALLALVKGTPESGDPANRLAEITFSRYPGPNPTARQDAMLAALFGDTEQVKSIRRNAEQVAARQAAQTKQARLEAAGTKTTPPPTPPKN